MRLEAEGVLRFNLLFCDMLLSNLVVCSGLYEVDKEFNDVGLICCKNLPKPSGLLPEAAMAAANAEGDDIGDDEVEDLKAAAEAAACCCC